MDTNTQQTPTITLADPLGSMVAIRWQWKESEQQIVQRSHGYLLRLATAANSLRKEAETQRVAGRLTDAGLHEHLENFASREFAPAYRQADHDGRRGIKRQIEHLRAQGVRKIDPTDAAAAVLRSDLRRAWFDMDKTQRKIMLHNPPAMLATAILEMPEAFHGLDADAADSLREAAFGHDFPEQAGQIEELRAVHEFVAAGLDVARDDAMRKMAIDTRQFNLLIWGGEMEAAS
ncbi:MAG: hypothetical protein PF480_02890 [Roseovarius sp.]|jgi:histone H3/H4|nr:hypothetical protein [Roseovarius sp.]